MDANLFSKFMDSIVRCLCLEGAKAIPRDPRPSVALDGPCCKIQH